MKPSKKESGDQDESLKGHVGSVINSSVKYLLYSASLLRSGVEREGERESQTDEGTCAGRRENKKERYMCTEVFESSVNP